ncbi:MAG: 50S ribosomal protein L9, partial [Proteobacteria bacterium]|nr:50S ribosomal protein L9 [Pseudomonadota bacterium]
MELILKKTIDTLGEEGDIVKVKPGYGRNYLIPRGKAVLATKANLAILEQEMNTIASRKEKERQAAEQLSKKIAG